MLQASQLIKNNNSTIEDALKKLNIKSKNEVGVVQVNGRLVYIFETILNDQHDEIHLFSPIFGG